MDRCVHSQRYREAVARPADRATPARVHYAEPFAVESLAAAIRERLSLYRWSDKRPWVLLCIGTDRLTGDALGPLVGTKLAASCGHSFYVYGTLADPVHALNLREKLREIYIRYENAFIVAVDASLGDPRNIGVINVGVGPLSPGAGVKRSLPYVGHLYITGVVSTGGLGGLLSTRLHLVMRQAEIIAAAILRAAREERAVTVLPPYKLSTAGGVYVR
mgnify:CR=1 FL=1